MEFPIILHVAQDGEIILGGDDYTAETLRVGLQKEIAVIKAEGKSVDDANVVIRAHKDTAAGDVQEVIRVAQEQKLDQLCPPREGGPVMKIRNREEAQKNELNMTSMIDIVFLLLIFFVMTFKIVELEGDFSVRMPLAGSDTRDHAIPPICRSNCVCGPTRMESDLDVAERDRPWGRL